jgi:hypothetical protein
MGRPAGAGVAGPHDGLGPVGDLELGEDVLPELTSGGPGARSLIGDDDSDGVRHADLSGRWAGIRVPAGA